MTRFSIYEGRVGAGYQYASGQAVGRADSPSPFPEGTLRMQQPHFKARAFDLEREVPDLFWGTINVRVAEALILANPDVTIAEVAWTREAGDTEIRPETFSFVRCCLAHEGRYYPGLIYYPHPETKPSTNAHDYHVLEVIAPRVETLRHDRPACVICRRDAFRPRLAPAG